METINPEQVGCSSERLERIGAVMGRYIDEGKIAGIQATVARCGKIVYSECFGYMDIESQKPIQPDTLYRIYSMTKPITSVAVMMLYEDGHFRLSEPVSRFIPEFKDMKVLGEVTDNGYELLNLEREITIWHLLTHTAGFSYGFEENDPVEQLIRKHVWRVFGQDTETTLKEVISNLTRAPLALQPGTAWRYSLATDVLGYLVEVVSGMPFDVFLKKRIFEPLGMVDTDFYVPEDKLERFAKLYGPDEHGRLKELEPLLTRHFSKPTKNPSGGGGLISTTADYAQFCQMLLNNGELDGVRLLGRKSIELMAMDHLEAIGHPFEDPARGFGLGFSVLADLSHYQALGSLGTYGWGGAANTNFWIDPKEELFGILMLQYMPSDTHPVIPDFRVAVYQSLID